MPRKESKVVPERNGPVPQQEELGSGQSTLADVYRSSEESLDRQQLKLIKSNFEQREKNLDKFMDDITRLLDQHVTSLEHDARQPRLAFETDGPANTKTRECTEGAVTDIQAKHGDSCTAQRVQDGPKTSTCFGVVVEPRDLPCREDVLVKNGAVASKSCLPSLEMRTTTAAGGLQYFPP